MAWKNNPEVIQYVLGFTAMLGAAGIGIMAKIADDVKNGDRPKFWSKELFLEIPTLLMMGLLAFGISEYLDLRGGAAAAVGAFLGWLGPKSVDIYLSYRFGPKFRKEREQCNKEN